MPRFLSWMGVGIAGAFLVVVGASLTLAVVMWLSFAISIASLRVSAAPAVVYCQDIPTLVTALVTALLSAWTIVASVVFSLQTGQDLGTAAGIVIAALALIGLTAHEIENELALGRSRNEADATTHESTLAAAA
jgi:hypothetical protein